MVEQWTQWKPVQGLSHKYYINSVIDMVDSFKIILGNAENQDEVVEIIFNNGVDAYTWVDESFRVKKIYELDKKYGIDFYAQWTFFKVCNSEYINWLSQQSYEWSTKRELIHYSFITADAILDVITDCAPEVKIVAKV